MIKKLPLFLLVLLLASVLHGQPLVESKQYGFSMQEPQGWLTANKAELAKNLQKFDFRDEESMAKLLRENNSSIMIASFSKYDPATRSGLIPTISVVVRSKPPLEFDSFKAALAKSMRSISQQFENFEAGEPADVMISGIRSFFQLSRFDLRMADGQLLKVRSRTYAIPMKNYFFQVNFTDGQTGEDCTSEFDALLRSIKIGR